MEESKEQQGLHRFMQFCIYLCVAMDIFIFICAPRLLNFPQFGRYGLIRVYDAISRLSIYSLPVYSRAFILTLVVLVCIGTLSKKEKDLDYRRAILYPLSLGLLPFFGGLWFYGLPGKTVFLLFSWRETAYCASLFFGTVLIHAAMGNISKIISSRLGKDRWNIEEESFMQATRKKNGPYQVSIPSLFYYRKKVHRGFINIENVFRGTLLIGTPGSGKSFGIVMPFIRQLIEKQFCICLYDYKFVRNEAV